jgi:hypothetical protein
MDKPSVKELQNTIANIKKIILTLDKKQIFDQTKREDYFFDNHPDIMSKYAMLVSQLCSGSDNGMLDIMLGHLQAIEDGKITQDKAEVKLGEQVAEKYLKLTPVDGSQ